jgi:hypothetical protein
VPGYAAVSELPISALADAGGRGPGRRRAPAAALEAPPWLS